MAQSRTYFTSETYARGDQAYVAIQDTIDIANTAAEQAALALAATGGAHDGQIVTFFQDAEPIGQADGDLWFDTGDGNKLYRWLAPYGNITRTNYCPNPSPEYGGQSFFSGRGVSVTVDSTVSISSRDTYRCLVTDVSSSGDLAQALIWANTIPTTIENAPWSCSAMMRSTSGSGIETYRARIVWLNNAGASLGTSEGEEIAADTPDTWVKVIVSGTAPAGCVRFSVEFGPDIASEIQVSDVFWVGDLVYEQASTTGEFFCGAMFDAEWVGTVGNSFSTTSPSWEIAQDQGIADALVAAAGAEAIADGKIRTFYQDLQPVMTTGENVGDLWIDTNDNNKLYRWSGTAWFAGSDPRVETQAQQIVALQGSLAGQAGLIDGKSVVYFQSTAPTGMGAAEKGDIWIDTSTPDRITRAWDGTAWANITDQKTLDMVGQIQGKITTFYQGAQPTATAIGDLWVDTASGNILKRWNGTVWQDATDSRTTTNATALTTLQGQYTGLSGKVDGKAVIWYQSTAPTGLIVEDQGDIWIDTSTANRVTKVWSGSAWQDVTDAKALEAFDQVQSKTTTFYASTYPTATAAGDLWIRTTDNRMFRAAGVGNAPANWIDITDTRLPATIKTVTTEYAVNSSETVAPVSGWSTATPVRTPGTFVWYRTTILRTDGGSSTTNPALLTGNTGATGSQGIPGTPGADGVSLYTWLKYADTPTTGMSDLPTGKAYMGLATNKSSPTESSVYTDYTWSVIKGQDGIQGPAGANGAPTYTWVKYGTSSTGAGLTDDPTGMTYIGMAFNKTTQVESTVTTDYAWSLIQGPPGTPAALVSLTSSTQVLAVPAAGGATTPATASVVGTAANTTIANWTYSVDGAAFSATVPAGVSRATNTVTITGSTMTAKTIAVRADNGSGVNDTITVAKVSDGATGGAGGTGTPGPAGADAYTVLLSNEAQVFAGSTTTGLPTSVSSTVIAYKGTVQQTARIGTITGQVTGLTTSIANNDTTSPLVLVTITASPALTTQSGTLAIPITVPAAGGTTFTKAFTWSVSYQGTQGIPGTPGANGTTTYTWLKYADTPTTGMSDLPAGKTYMGLSMNQTSSTESSVYTDYTWSLIKGTDGVQGPPGANGITTYTWVKYASDVNGTGITDDPTGKTYIGLAFNKTTAVESTLTTDYAWSLIQGAPGAAGVSVTSVTPYFQALVTGSAAPATPSASPPPGPWTITEPSYAPNTELWRTERILYSNATFSYTTVTKVSSYAAAVAAQATADGKNEVYYSTNTPGTAANVAGDLWYQYSVDGQVIGFWIGQGGTTWAIQQLTDSTIATLNVGKLTTGELGVAVRMIAGDETSSHAEVTGTGFYAYAEPSAPGEPPPMAVRMGTAENDLFSITNVDGDTVASISDTGVGAFAGASFDGPVYVDGMPLLGLSGNTDLPVDYPPDGTTRDWTASPRGIIETYAKGNVQWFGFNTSSNTASIPNGGWLKIFDVGFDLEAGRQYAVNVPPILMTTSSGTGVGLILRYTTDGSLPTETSTILSRDYETMSSLGFASVSISGRLVNGGTTTQSQIRVLGMLYNFSGGAAATVFGGEYITVSITDLGLTKSAQGNVLNQVSAGGTGGGGTPVAPAPKPYVKTYSSNGWASYRSKNALLRGADGNVGDTGGKLSQGYSSSGSYNGDQQGLWTFPSIQGDVGAGTITKVEAYIYFSHWYNSSGGTAFLRTHNYADNGWPTGSLPAMAASVTSPSWPKPGGRWVTLPNTNGTAYNGGSGSWRSGGIKGFGIGPASSTSTTYYGNANAAAQLRISYTK